MVKKCLLLYSNGLDSRLCLKIMQEKGYSVLGVYFKLPFSKDFSDDAKEFFKENSASLKILDYTKGKKLNDYLDVILKHKFNFGSGLNPCFDCKIFMFKKAKEIAKKEGIGLVVSGEVLGQRPMSQTENGLKLIENNSGLKGKILRPLSEKILSNVKGVDSKEYFDFSGRQRKLQIFLADKFGIKYPLPAGGCLLCERLLRKRFEFLIKGKFINGKTVKMINIGRHFNMEGDWFVVSRDEKESNIIEEFQNSLPSSSKVPAVYFSNSSKKDIAIKLQKAYKEKKHSLFKEYKL